ncbi:MAG: NRDE family protein [Planctomycetota bacterium]
MCSLIVLRGLDAAYPIVVAANRDEKTDRKSSPPGIWRGGASPSEHADGLLPAGGRSGFRMLAPRDRVAGGTWLGVDERGRFAGLTNVFGELPVAGAPSRGLLPFFALAHEDLSDAADAVLARVAATPHSGFQLVLADADRTIVLRHAKGRIERTDWADAMLAISNEHAAGSWQPRFVEPALVPDLSVDARLEELLPSVQDRGGDGLHRVCKHGDSYATVSCSLLAIPAVDHADGIQALRWRYAAGPPDTTAFRNYSNLAARLGESPR